MCEGMGLGNLSLEGRSIEDGSMLRRNVGLRRIEQNAAFVYVTQIKPAIAQVVEVVKAIESRVWHLDVAL